MIPSFDSPRVRGSYTNVHNVFSSYSNAFQTGAASIPFMAARSRLLETAVSDSNRHRYPRPRPLATHPLPHERQVCADSAIRHCRASHRDLVCNHHATTLLRSELRIAGDEAAGEVQYKSPKLNMLFGDEGSLMAGGFMMRVMMGEFVLMTV
ncbi:hypothetical protein DEO72_LG10g1193 [Vigna unguiculata]|uniref:Uncharacterized protein n=1 Tax=Vigna unguiculata TaxID=3917 RepID=A0A4D6N815_VIGUN|nr:hypothetical protein DEO72_LG10g1193 [Vigna unguiculata]